MKNKKGEILILQQSIDKLKEEMDADLESLRFKTINFEKKMNSEIKNKNNIFNNKSENKNRFYSFKL